MPLSWLLKGFWYSKGCFHDRRCFPVYMLCGICMDPINWTGLPTIDLFSERIDKIRGKTHSTSSRCSACKLNTQWKGLMTCPIKWARVVTLFVPLKCMKIFPDPQGQLTSKSEVRSGQNLNS